MRSSRRCGWLSWTSKRNAPRPVPLLIEHKRGYLGDPEFRRLCLAYDAAYGQAE